MICCDCGGLKPTAAAGAAGGALPAGTAEGQILVWDADTGRWIPEGAPIADGQILVWSSALEEWVAQGGITSPLDVIPAANIVAGWVAGQGEVLNGTGVAQWNDYSGNGNHLIQATAANQPTFSPVAGPNNRPAILFDGVNDRLVNTLLDLPAPGTTPTFYWSILRQVTWTANDRFFGAGAGNNGLVLKQVGISPAVVQADNVDANSNTGLTLNTYKRIEVYFSNTVADYIKAGSITTTGQNAANIDPATVFSIGSDGPGIFFANEEVCEFWIFKALPSAAELTRLNSYAS